MAGDQRKTFDVIFEGIGRASGKMRNNIAVEWPMMKERFELATDEGAFTGATVRRRRLWRCSRPRSPAA